MARVLVCDPIADEAVIMLRGAGIRVDFVRSPPPSVLRSLVGPYDAIVVRSATKVTREVIDAAENLKVIARAGAGLDNIDVEYARSKGIEVISSPEALSVAVAELTMGLMICLMRRVCDASRSLKGGRWLKHEFLGAELYGKVLGIVGLGRIGSEVAKRAKAFGMRVIGYRRHRLEEVARQLGVEPAESLDDLLSRSDVISIHVPLTRETRHMIGEGELGLVKRGVFIVNTARGAVIDGKSLLRALDEGVVAGAALDVHEHEPPTEEWEWRLIRHPRVLPTPHIGSMTREAQRRAGVIIASKLIERLKSLGLLERKR